MAEAKQEQLTIEEVTKLTPENSTEFSLQLILEDPHDEIIQQELLEIATHHSLRSYSNNFFTHPNEKVLRSFQAELMTKDINCQFIFRSPKPLKF